MWDGIDARITVERLHSSKSTDVPAIAAGKEREDVISSSRKPADRAITSGHQQASEEHGQRAPLSSFQRSKYVEYLNGLRTCAWRYCVETRVPFVIVLSQTFSGMHFIIPAASDENSEMG